MRLLNIVKDLFHKFAFIFIHRITEVELILGLINFRNFIQHVKNHKCERRREFLPL